MKKMKSINIIIYLCLINFAVGFFGTKYGYVNDNPFERGKELVNSDKWKKISDGLWWHTFKQYSKWPYFKYTVCTNVSISDNMHYHDILKMCNNLMDIEVNNYEICSKNWIDQLISGYEITKDIEYLQYDFFPLTNRDVCQQSSQIPFKGGHQIYFTTNFTRDYDKCPNQLKIHMFEDVHKFIYPDIDENGNACNRMTYVGVEDPKGDLDYFRWSIKYLYVYFYQQHFRKYKKFLKSIE